jgi:hypothetical protein
MDIQSLLFDRDAGWTADKAKQWAKSHGYKHGKVHVTDQYVRVRQFDPKGLKVKRTITLGRGIRAVVAKEEDMAAKRKRSKKSAAPKTHRRKPRRHAKEAPVAEAKRPRRRRAKAVAPAPAPRRRRRRAKVAASVAAPRRRRPARRRRARAPASGGYMMEASRRRRPRRRRATAREAWHGDRAGHRKAAKKGWSKRKRRSSVRRTTKEARRSPRRRRKAREAFAYESPRRRPRRRARRAREQVMEASRRPRRRSYRRAREAKRGGGSAGHGEKAMEILAAVVAGGVGFVLADAVDRFLATYDPSSTAALPTDRFTSSGAGTLANTLNVAAAPSLYRVGASAGFMILPAVASVFVDQPLIRSSLEGMAVGGGVSLFRLLWNNVVMPLLAPKDTSTAGLQKSIIARLYPAEIAAHINMAQTPPQQAVSSSGSGALSGPPAGHQTGVGSPDVGPFALSGTSPYPDAAQALRQTAGMSGPGGNFPSLQNVWGTGEYPTAAQAMGLGADQAISDMTKTVAQILPGLHPVQAMQAATEAAKRPHDIAGALIMVLPHVSVQALMQCAQAIHPHVARLHAAAPGAPATPATPPAPAVPAPAAPAAPVATPAAATTPVATSPVAPPGVTGHGYVGQPPAYQPGPASTPGPGPQLNPNGDCGCGVAENNQFLGFVGDSEEKDLFFAGGQAA